MAGPVRQDSALLVTGGRCPVADTPKGHSSCGRTHGVPSGDRFTACGQAGPSAGPPRFHPPGLAVRSWPSCGSQTRMLGTIGGCGCVFRVCGSCSCKPCGRVWVRWCAPGAVCGGGGMGLCAYGSEGLPCMAGCAAHLMLSSGLMLPSIGLLDHKAAKVKQDLQRSELL